MITKIGYKDLSDDLKSLIGGGGSADVTVHDYGAVGHGISTT